MKPLCDICWPHRSNAKLLNVALQGGGAHGAFTWGVLDRMLEDERIAIEAISGTSAGAMNAIVMAEGLAEGGPDKAREQLEAFWRSISVDQLSSPFQRQAFDTWLFNWGVEFNPLLAMFDAATRYLSPYQFNPLNVNPLRDHLLSQVDFGTVRRCRGMQLFIGATNVRTGRVKVFTGDEITCEAVLASACLPLLFQAVEIDGEAYWDGGYVANPPLEPFLRGCHSPDVLLVQINPVARDERPLTARQIMDRVNEISFNAPLLRELRSVEFVNECLDRGELAGRGYRRTYLHRIDGGHDLARLNASSKLVADWSLFAHLKELGRKSADAWLAANYDAIGVRSTLQTAHLMPSEPAAPSVRS